MPFTVFTSSTTAYANEVMDNFYHVAQGDRLPMGGALLEPTASVFNLGSAAYKWDEVYCTEINATHISKIETLIQKTVFSTAGQSIEISGLTGDAWYELRCSFPMILGSGTKIYMILNGNTGAVYYGGYYTSYFDNYLAAAGERASDSISSIFVVPIPPTTTVNSTSALSLFSVYSNGSGQKTIHGRSLGKAYFETTTAGQISTISFSTANILETLTSIKIYSNTTTGIPINSIIELWSR